MRTYLVVLEAKLRQRQVQVTCVGDGVAAQRRLERAEQALDSAVLSGAGEFRKAQPHARHAHDALEPRGMVDGMVVELEYPWYAMFAEREEQRPQQSPGIETPYASQCDIASRAVIDDARHDVRHSLADADVARVESPDVATRLRGGHQMFPCASPMQRFIRLFLAQLTHPCAADREARRAVTLVEDVCQLAVTPLRMTLVIAEHRVPDPLRFPRWESVRGGWSRGRVWWAAACPAPHFFAPIHRDPARVRKYR